MGILDITILYAEDEVVILNSVSMILEKRVKKVYTAQNGVEGMQLFEKYRPDVVIADISMPKMDGLMMARRIKAIDPSTVIIVLSAFDKKENLLEAIKVGVERFLPKPLNYDQLLRIINELHSTKILKRRVEKEKLARQSAELELAKTEQKYQDLYDNAPDMYFSVSPEGITKDVNQFGSEYLGYTKDELVGQSVWKIIHHDDLKEVKRQVSQIFKNKEEFSELEFRKVRKDSSILHVHERTQLIFDETGHPYEMRIICRDITDRKRVQHALEESEERYRLVVEQTGQVVFDVDYIHNTIDVVGAVQEILGFSKNDISEIFSFENAIKIVHPEDKDGVLNTIKKAKRTGTRFQFECRLQKKNNEFIFAEVNGICLVNNQGEVERILGSAGDITLRKEHEAKLQEMNEYVRNLIESSLTMFICVDNDRRIVEFNSAAEKNFGYKKKEVLGQHVQLLYADAGECARIGKLQKKSGTFYGIVRNKRKNGEEFVSYLSSALMQDVEGNQIGSVGNSIDITESQERERQLKLKEELYKALVETAQNGFSIFDLKGTIVFCNKYIADMLGYDDHKELIGKAWIDFIVPDDRNHVTRKIKNMVEKDSGIVHLNIHIVKKDGTIIPVDFRASVIHDENGNPKQVMDTMTDLTSRGGEEKKYKEIKDKGSEILRNLSAAVIEFDKTGKINLVNDYATILSGYSKDELMQLSISKLFISDAKYFSGIISYFADKLHTKSEPTPWKGTLITKNEDHVPVIIRWNYIWDEHERIVGFAGVVSEE